MEQVSQELTCLLTEYYGEYYIPENWESSKKAINFIARITKGEKYVFDRKFLNTYNLDDNICYKKSHFKEGEIFEQKCTFRKGKKEEILFHGFFIVKFDGERIMGEEISQKDALEYFDCRGKLPEIATDIQRNKLKMKLGSVIRQLTLKYGEELMVSILMDIMNDYFPTPN
ncbi:MAG: hypothetical protein ACTSRK_01480 [Promethearchaeota archaeon]